MEKVQEIASYICSRYEEQWGKCIEEMKLHKLLYFCQRESIVQTGVSLFADDFEAWKYGPVLVDLRQAYQQNELHIDVSETTIQRYKKIFDKVFEIYAPKDSWSLSTLTRGEISWQKARRRMNANGDKCAIMHLDDIRDDAKRIRIRRFLLEQTDILKKIC